MATILEELSNLVALQKLDLEKEKLEKEIRSVPEEIERIHKQIEDGRKFLQEEKGVIQRLQLELKNHNLELETTEQQITKHTIELNTIKSNQAYSALLNEINDARAKKSETEDLVIKALDDIERETKKLEAKTLELKEEERKSQETVKSLNEKEQSLKEILARKNEERVQLANSIEKRFLARYEQLRSRKSNLAVVPVDGHGCSGCYRNLSAQNYNELCHLYKDPESAALVYCENCSRIIYFPEGPGE